jgi:hypothetical protein
VSEAAMTADEFRRKQRNKNLAVGFTVAAVMVLFFIITIVRFGGH